MGRTTTPLVLIAGALLASACGPPRDAAVRRERLAAERRALEQTLDHLEDRLLVNQARVRFWNEMRSRHESVTAVACASQEEHAEEMARHQLPPPGPRTAARAADQPRVAAAAARGRTPPAAAQPARRAPASASN